MVTLLLAVVPIVLLVLLATRRPRLRTCGTASGKSADALFKSPACRLDGIRVTHIIELHDDLLVGYRGGIGSWLSLEDPPFGTVRPWDPDSQGELLLPRLVRNADSMLLLQRWRAYQTPLTSAVSADRTLIGLADWQARRVVVAALAIPE